MYSTAPFLSLLPVALFVAYLVWKEVIWYFACVPVVALASILLSCLESEDYGYTSPVDWLLCPRTLPVRDPNRSTVVVLGSSRGLGRDLLASLVAKGYFVVGTVRKPVDAESLVGEFGTDRVLPVFLELTSDESIRNACQQIAGFFKGQGGTVVEPSRHLAAIVAMAGITSMGPFEGVPFDQLRTLLETNVLGTMHVLHRVMPIVRAHQARIVVAGAPDVPLPQYAVKSACNGALLAFTRALRADLWGLGVSVSIVQPAATRGGMVVHGPKMVRTTREAMPPSLRAVYPPGFRLMMRNEGAGDFGLDPGWATRAFEHAISSPRPKTRYSTTPPGTALYFASFLVPDRLLEMLMFMGPLGPGGPEVVVGESEEEPTKTKTM